MKSSSYSSFEDQDELDEALSGFSEDPLKVSSDDRRVSINEKLPS